MSKEKVMGLALVGALSLAGIAAGIAMVALHMVDSLVEAVDMLHYCYDEGWDECRIERDGLNYNVYNILYEDNKLNTIVEG